MSTALAFLFRKIIFFGQNSGQSIEKYYIDAMIWKNFDWNFSSFSASQWSLTLEHPKRKKKHYLKIGFFVSFELPTAFSFLFSKKSFFHKWVNHEVRKGISYRSDRSCRVRADFSIARFTEHMSCARGKTFLFFWLAVSNCYYIFNMRSIGQKQSPPSAAKSV